MMQFHSTNIIECLQGQGHLLVGAEVNTHILIAHVFKFL